jgi:hypothetical protein
MTHREDNQVKLAVHSLMVKQQALQVSLCAAVQSAPS